MERDNSAQIPTGLLFRALVVSLILDAKVEQALELLARAYRTDVPTIKVGIPRSQGGHISGCYTVKDKTIHVRNHDAMKEPFVILHEFYHHLRTSVDKKHRGTEKYANAFAMGFVEVYESFKIRRSAAN